MLLLGKKIPFVVIKEHQFSKNESIAVIDEWLKGVND